jgi:hypothetical protein
MKDFNLEVHILKTRSFWFPTGIEQQWGRNPLPRKLLGIKALEDINVCREKR